MQRTKFEQTQEKRRVRGVGRRPLEVAYQDAGAGAPAVFLHGIPAWSFLWSKIIDPLAETARVIAPDLIGYGYSDKRDCFDRSVRRQAHMVVRLMDALDLQTATVVGHDIGGAVAQVLAVDHPERVHGLVLVDSVAYGSWPSSSMVSLGDPNLLGRSQEIMEIVRHDATIGHEDRVDAEAFARDMAVPYESEEGRRSMVRNASALNTNHTMELTGRLEAIDVPALVLWGEEDPWQPLSDAKQLAQDIPNADLVTIPGGSHWLPFDRPEETARHLKRFMVHN